MMLCRWLSLLPWASFALGAFGSVACGSAPRPSPQAPAMSPAPEALGESLDADEAAPDSLNQAEADLERARGDFEAATVGPTPPGTSGAAAPRAPADAREKERFEQQEASVPASSPDQKQAPKAAPPCQNACSAFASLLRAKDAICRLEVPSGPRCARAQRIVRDAEPRVLSCECQNR